MYACLCIHLCCGKLFGEDRDFFLFLRIFLWITATKHVSQSVHFLCYIVGGCDENQWYNYIAIPYDFHWVVSLCRWRILWSSERGTVYTNKTEDENDIVLHCSGTNTWCCIQLCSGKACSEHTKSFLSFLHILDNGKKSRLLNCLPSCGVGEHENYWQ